MTASIMQRPIDVREALEEARDVPIAVFLERFKGKDLELYLWDFLYDDMTCLTLTGVTRVVQDLEADQVHTIGRVLDGWRPRSLLRLQEDRS